MLLRYIAAKHRQLQPQAKARLLRKSLQTKLLNVAQRLKKKMTLRINLFNFFPAIFYFNNVCLIMVNIKNRDKSLAKQIFGKLKGKIVDFSSLNNFLLDSLIFWPVKCFCMRRALVPIIRFFSCITN